MTKEFTMSKYVSIEDLYKDKSEYLERLLKQAEEPLRELYVDSTPWGPGVPGELVDYYGWEEE